MSLLPLKEATTELHKKAERMPFNQKMFKGELTEYQYLVYLYAQTIIFQCIEEHDLSVFNPNIKRLHKVFADFQELDRKGNHKIPEIKSVKQYGIYLESLKGENLYPHVYLNYLALAYGGQMMKSKVPGSGTMYDFENMQECVASIRMIQKDEWADEVNKGFQYIINILEELETKVL